MRNASFYFLAGTLHLVFFISYMSQTSPTTNNTSAIILYGKPANGSIATEKVIPTTAKKAITHEVQPYVNNPKRIEKLAKFVALPSLPLTFTSAVEKLNMMALNPDIIILMTIFKTTKDVPN